MHRVTSFLISFLLCAAGLIGTITHVYSQQQDAEKTDSHGEFIGAMPTTYPDWFKESFLELNEDVAEAAAQDRQVMVLFHQDGCPYCNAFVERNLAQVDIEQTLRSKFDVIAINMWGDREVAHIDGNVYTEKTFAAALEVQFTPTILFLDDAAQLALRLNGYYDPDRFRLALDYVSAPTRTQSFNEYLAAHGATKGTGKLTSRDYFQDVAAELSDRAGAGSKPLALFFEQADCSNCDVLHDDVLAQAENQALLSEFDIFQINMWSDEPIVKHNGDQTTGREWARELGVIYAPTMILFSADDEEVIRSEAYFKSFHTQSLLDYVVSDAWREEPSFQRYISARAEALQAQGNDVNIWE